MGALDGQLIGLRGHVCVGVLGVGRTVMVPRIGLGQHADCWQDSVGVHVVLIHLCVLLLLVAYTLVGVIKVVRVHAGLSHRWHRSHLDRMILF
jgi:hypothetical protein